MNQTPPGVAKLEINQLKPEWRVEKRFLFCFIAAQKKEFTQAYHTNITRSFFLEPTWF